MLGWTSKLFFLSLPPVGGLCPLEDPSHVLASVKLHRTLRIALGRSHNALRRTVAFEQLGRDALWDQDVLKGLDLTPQPCGLFVFVDDADVGPKRST